jgi:hypothetical protein
MTRPESPITVLDAIRQLGSVRSFYPRRSLDDHHSIAFRPGARSDGDTR